MNDISLIPLRAESGAVRAYAIVDAADAAWANQWHWSLSKWGYAVRGARVGGRKLTIRLHREILGLVHGDGFDGDHIDRHKLNCQRKNLRILPGARSGNPNAQNTGSRPGSSSSYRGVGWDKKRGKWWAKVHVARGTINLGRFASELEAAEAARLARLRLMPYSVEAEAAS